MFSGLDHVGFAVSDLDRSMPFYTRLLGEEPLLREVENIEYLGHVVGYQDAAIDTAFWRLPGGAFLELIQYLSPSPGQIDMETYNAGNAHLCLVAEDVDAEFERMRGYAVFRSPTPIAIPWGPYKGGRAAYIRDPDGISIELIQLPPGGLTL